MKKCPKCNFEMVYSDEYLVLWDGVEVEVILCKQCDYKENVKETA